MLHKLLGHFARLRRIADRADKTSPYLDRWYIFGNATSRWFLALHQIHKSDADGHLHNHPWPYLACQLAGLMYETTPGGTHKRRPGYLRWRSRASLHRLTLPNGPVWSLFLGGPRVGSWGFRVGGAIIDHKDYL
jgi:hypothetical protein